MAGPDGAPPSARVVRYPPPTPLRRTFGWLTVSAFTLFLVLIPVGSLAVAVAALFRPRKYVPVLGLLVAMALWPHRKWPAWEVACGWLFEIWCEIFDTTLIYEGEGGEGDELRASSPTSFALLVHPHGVIPVVGNMIWGATLRHGLHPTCFGGSNVALAMPFFRQFLMWNGGVSADKRTVIAALKRESSFSVFSGGIREMMATHNDKETLVLSSRSGVVKLAKEHGKAIVPVLVLGCTQHFRRWPSPTADWLQRCSRTLRSALLLPYGRWGLPIPLYARTTIIFGAAIDTGTGSVEELHARWMQWYKDAYARHARAAGVADRELVIL